MEKFDINQVVLCNLAQAKSQANERLQESPSEKFNHIFEELILEEISKGQKSAENYKSMIKDAESYTYTAPFSLAIYEKVSEETLLRLEHSDIYLGKNNVLGTASIQIVFHF